MKKLFIVLVFALGVGHSASAQSDFSLISSFMNSVVNQDVNAMMEVLHPDCYDEIEQLMTQSQELDFKSWTMVGSVTYDNGFVSYIVAAYIGDDSPAAYNFFGEEAGYYVSPSGHVFLYEEFVVLTHNGKKYIYTNADMLDMAYAEQILRRGGKTIPSSYYQRY